MPTNTVAVIPFAVGVKPSLIDETDVTKVANVEDGASIRGFSCVSRIFNETGVADSGQIVFILRKNENGQLPVPTLAQMASLGTNPWKNRIFHAEQAILGSQVSGFPMAVPGFKVPKKFHRMANADQWELIICNFNGQQIRCCGIFMYKWYK